MSGKERQARPARIPLSTYRLQFNKDFGFKDARRIVPYLHALGITDVYASPLLRAVPGSRHGYDVTNPSELNPELGTRADFESFARELRELDMGLIVDIVPNHMAAHHDNTWWWDVLDRGRNSSYAAFFDIDWDAGNGKVSLPVLGEPLGSILSSGQLIPILTDRGFELHYHEHRFPLNPDTYGYLIDEVPDLAGMGILSDAESTQVQATTTAPRDQRAALLLWRARNAEALDELNERLSQLPRRSPAKFSELVDRQAYSLAYWREGIAAINYRRFFDITSLVALQADREDVFRATHSLVLDLVRSGCITGLRVDHIDGLADPGAYLNRLSAAAAPAYLIVEKILGPKEHLPASWPVHGTTGYDFLNTLQRVLVDPDGVEHLRSPSNGRSLIETATDAKKDVLESLFRAELGRLLAPLERLNALAHQQLSPSDLHVGVVELTACLDVYRTYLTPETGPDQDHARLDAACSRARARGAPSAAIDFIRDVLILSPALITDPRQRADATQALRLWQQLSGPVMAKGVEDTALYRDTTMLALNEVGAELEEPRDPVVAFHAFNQAVAARHPWTMTTTSTHDTKRSEDARARIAVLSELPGPWLEACARWRELVSTSRSTVQNALAPNHIDESHCFQSLVGIFEPGIPDLGERLETSLLKAAREAKISTSWLDPNEPYENALRHFVRSILDPARSQPFLDDLERFCGPIRRYGLLNSISQTVLRLAAPGVADTYQGSELLNLALVDPDNRRPFNFFAPRGFLQGFAGVARSQWPDLVRSLRDGPIDGRLKLWVLTRGLHLRKVMPGVFLFGAYTPLEPQGTHHTHVCAFTRHHAGQWVCSIAPRLCTGLSVSDSMPIGPCWRDTEVALPQGAPDVWCDAFTGRTHRCGGRFRLAEVFADLPVALLSSVPSVP